MDPTQRELFDAAMAADIAALEAQLDDLRSPTAPSPAPRRTPQRRALPAELPRIGTIHEPASCDCATCGRALVKIGEHVSEKLDVQPLKFFVRREVHPQYACRTCETIVAEPVAPSILDRGIAAPGLLAQVAIHKYADHLPLYRQEAIFARHGIEIGRTTLAEWTGDRAALATAGRCPQSPAQARPCCTPTGAGRPARPGCRQDERTCSRIERAANDPSACSTTAQSPVNMPPPSRRAALMVDDYADYKALFERGVTELACWACRRGFFDAHAASTSGGTGGFHRIGGQPRLKPSCATSTTGRGVERAAASYGSRPSGLADAAREHPRQQWRTQGNRLCAATMARAAQGRRRRLPIDNNRSRTPSARSRRPQELAVRRLETAASRCRDHEPDRHRQGHGTNPTPGSPTCHRLPTTKDRDIDTLLPLA